MGISQIKKLAFIIILPVLVMGLFNIGIVYFSTTNISNSTNTILKDSFRISKFISNIATVNDELVHTQIDVKELINSAVNKTKKSLDLYKEHSRVVDKLSEIENKIKSIFDNQYLIAAHKKIINKIWKEFYNYKQEIIQTTDIVSIDPAIAEKHIILSQKYYISYSLVINELISEISKETTEEFSKSIILNEAVYYKIITYSFLISLIILAISVFVTKYLNDYILKLLNKIRLDSEKLKQLNNEKEKLIATKDKFFKIIAHDLKSPFTPISGFTDVLLECCSPNHSKCSKQINMMEMIKKSAETCFKLLNDLLDWARIQTGEINFSPDFIDIKNMIAEIILLLQYQANQKNITINNFLHKTQICLADYDMIMTVLRNIVSNAIKFTMPGGIINIKDNSNNEKIEISISDTGIGISEKNLSLLFDISSKYSNKGTAGETGTGLGLILCKEFIEKNKGKITVSSEIGKGTEFRILLPAGKNGDG